MTFSVVISGATGRVGNALCEYVQSSDAHRLAGALASSASSGKPVSHASNVVLNAECAPPVDAVIDFSTSDGALRAIDVAQKFNAPIVVATTALSDEAHGALQRASNSIPTLLAPNTSLGAAMTTALAASASRSLGTTYDVSIVEAHRAGKRDAPSGTALWIAEMARRAGANVRDDQIFSIRGGDTVGEHVIRFSGPGEVVEITHRVSSRIVFGIGALRCAEWLVGKSPGAYSVSDVLGVSMDD